MSRIVPFLAAKSASGRMLNSFVIFVTAPCLICVVIGMWLCSEFLLERRVAERAGLLNSLADATCVAIDPLLRAGDESAVRRVVLEVARTPGIRQATLFLADGRVLADSSSRRVDLLSLPPDWHGPINLPIATEENAESPFLLKSIDFPGRGQLYLRLTLEPPGAVLSITEISSFALLAVASLLIALFAFRRFDRQVKSVTSLSDAVSALATRSNEPLDQIRLGESICREAPQWNSILDRFQALEQSARADAIRSMLGKPANTPEPGHDASSGNRNGLEAIVDMLPTGVILLDSGGAIRSANGAGAALLGRDREGIIGIDIRTLVTDAAFIDAVSSTLTRNQGGERRTLEIDRREQAGGVLRLSVRPLRREDQGGGLLTIEDVTQQRIADSSRNQFVAQATHELRAPLTNMRLCLETALEDDAGNLEAISQHLNVLNEETRRLERLVSEMLSVAEIEAGSLTLKNDDVRLDRLFEDLQANNSAACVEKQQQLSFQLPPKLPLLRGDREKLSAALHNLLNNAVKYTPSGGQISVTARQEDTRFIIEVADTGFGISPEDQARLFERFFRARDPRVAGITGTGLGLALSREVARLHGGDLSFKSELNKGTTFIFQLPVAMQPT